MKLKGLDKILLMIAKSTSSQNKTNIGTLTDLETTDKTNLVGAVNEANAKQASATSRVDAHVAGTAEKHAAEKVTYSGSVVGATDVKQGIDLLKARVDEIITTPISGEAAAQELIDARGGNATLGDRFGGIDSQLADAATQINTLDAEKANIIGIDTHTETISTNPRPVMKTIQETFAPNALITNVTDIHGIDLIVETSEVANLGTNKVALYPFESRCDNKGAGSIVLGTGGYFLARNSGGGSMATAQALRINVQNAGVGSTITNAMGINIDNPTNSAGGTALNTFSGLYIQPLSASVNNNYGIYINPVTGGANRNFGIYNLASKNYSKGTEFIDGGNLILGAMTATVGAGGTNVLGITKGTAPAASIPDMVQIYSAILPNTKATLGLMFHEQVVGDVALASTHSLTVALNQRIYKIPLVDVTPV